MIKIANNLTYKNLLNFSLDGVRFSLRVYANSRDNQWYFDLKTRDTVLLTGKRFVSGIELVTKYRLPELNGNGLVVLNLGNTSEDLTLTNFGGDKDYSLVLLSSEEVEEFGGVT